MFSHSKAREFGVMRGMSLSATSSSDNDLLARASPAGCPRMSLCLTDSDLLQVAEVDEVDIRTAFVENRPRPEGWCSV